MKIKTTTIGAYPKPACTPIGDWFPDTEDEVLGEQTKAFYNAGALLIMKKI